MNRRLARPDPLAQLALLVPAAALLLGCGAQGPAGRPAAVADQVERLGDLELVTHSQAVRGGDAARFAWTTTRTWSLRWRGAPLPIPTLSGLWGDRPLTTPRLHTVFVIERPEARWPDLLVLVGDPNNTSAFHRVTPPAAGVSTAPEMPLLCLTSGGANQVAWVPTWPQAAPTGPAFAASATSATSAAQAALQGGTRWGGPTLQRLRPQADGPKILRLGEHCFYDTLSRRLQVTPPLPANLSLITAHGPSLLSPDGRSLARLALLDLPSPNPNPRPIPVLAVAPLLTLPQGLNAGGVPAYTWLEPHSPRWRHLPIDRSRMRVARLDQIDLGWLARHWHWQPPPADAQTADAAWTLVERRGFQPLPHRGWYFPGVDQYSIDGLTPGGLLVLVRAVAAELGGDLQPGAPRPGGLPPIPVLHVDGIDVHLGDRSLYIAPPLRPNAADPASDPRQRQALIRRIGEALDRLLATGAHDRLFDFTR